MRINRTLSVCSRLEALLTALASMRVLFIVLFMFMLSLTTCTEVILYRNTKEYLKLLQGHG